MRKGYKSEREKKKKKAVFVDDMFKQQKLTSMLQD